MQRFLGMLWVVAGAAALAGCASPGDDYFLSQPSGANVCVLAEGRQISKVAIMPFKAPTELIGSSVSDLFVTEMLKAGRYELVERGQMAQVLSESELALAGLSASKAVEVGNMLGADGVIIGTVDEYSTVAQRGRTYPVVGMSVRLIDCKSGKVVWSVDCARKAETRDVTLPQHARAVVHEMVSGLYREWRRSPR
jgi:curli biogenesis system outer membrane secretion channel CsgG